MRKILTRRDIQQILDLNSQGKCNREIVEHTGLSISTVANKLKLHGRNFNKCLRQPKWTKKYCHECALKCNSRSEFSKKFGAQYQFAVQNGFLNDICKHMELKHRSWTKEECWIAALKCNTRWEFQKRFGKQYIYALRNGFLEDICEHMVPGERGSGWTKTDFIRNCDRNNKGKGILYLIKCTGNGEEFYKWGITSSPTVAQRFRQSGKSPNTHLPYNYEILYKFVGDSANIWDNEKIMNRRTQKYRYQPDLWKYKNARETFKCHGNCKLVSSPKPPLDCTALPPTRVG